MASPNGEVASPADTADAGTTSGESEGSEGEGEHSHYVAPHETPYRAAAASEIRADDFTHKDQFGMRLGVGINAFFALRTTHSPPCGSPRTSLGDLETFCRGIGVGIIDADISYGVSDGIELTLLGQFGMTSDPLTAYQHEPHVSAVVLGFGLRLYPSPHDRVKPFFGFRAVTKFVDAHPDPTEVPNFSQWDVGARGEGGLMVEITRAVGLYAQVAISIFFVNGFTLPFDFTGGAQVRFP